MGEGSSELARHRTMHEKASQASRQQSRNYQGIWCSAVLSEADLFLLKEGERRIQKEKRCAVAWKLPRDGWWGMCAYLLQKAVGRFNWWCRRRGLDCGWTGREKRRGGRGGRDPMLGRGDEGVSGVEEGVGEEGWGRLNLPHGRKVVGRKRL